MMIQTTDQKRATMRSLSSFHPLPEQLVLSVESGRLYSTASGLGCIEDGIPSAPCAPCNVAAETTAATNHEDSRRQPFTNMPPKSRPPLASPPPSPLPPPDLPPPPSPTPPSPPFSTPPPTPSPPSPPPPSTWMHGWVDERMIGWINGYVNGCVGEWMSG